MVGVFPGEMNGMFARCHQPLGSGLCGWLQVVKIRRDAASWWQRLAIVNPLWLDSKTSYVHIRGEEGGGGRNVGALEDLFVGAWGGRMRSEPGEETRGLSGSGTSTISHFLIR